ncbi:hypothetical protein D3C71_1719780 [compost metagenome]
MSMLAGKVVSADVFAPIKAAAKIVSTVAADTDGIWSAGNIPTTSAVVIIIENSFFLTECFLLIL